MTLHPATGTSWRASSTLGSKLSWDCTVRYCPQPKGSNSFQADFNSSGYFQGVLLKMLLTQHFLVMRTLPLLSLTGKMVVTERGKGQRLRNMTETEQYFHGLQESLVVLLVRKPGCSKELLAQQHTSKLKQSRNLKEISAPQTMLQLNSCVLFYQNLANLRSHF